MQGLTNPYFLWWFQHFTGYGTVMDLIFQNGELVAAKDLSEEVGRLQQVLCEQAQQEEGVGFSFCLALLSAHRAFSVC